MKRRLAVLGANAPLLPFYKHARELDIEIIGIAWKEGAVCKQYCDRFYPISFSDKEAVLDVCQKEHIDGITSFSLESALPTVIYVATQMNLVSNSMECLELTLNKFTMRNAFEKAGIPVPRYYMVMEKEDFNNIEIRFPAIIKPVDSGGSQGVNKVNNLKELEDAYSYAKDHSRTKTVIVEEFIDGREFSVEYISCNGVHHNLQITDKVTSGAPHFVEMQHHQPADINQETANRIREMVEKALTTLKIQNSPSHTEIKLNSCGELYIIEVGPRQGGDYITSDLVRLSTGYDMVHGAVNLALGNFTTPQLSKSMHSGVYFYCQLAPEIGDFILHHNDYPEIVECEYIDEPLPEVHSNADRGGYLLYQSDKKLILTNK